MPQIASVMGNVSQLQSLCTPPTFTTALMVPNVFNIKEKKHMQFWAIKAENKNETRGEKDRQGESVRKQRIEMRETEKGGKKGKENTETGGRKKKQGERM
jgi:hypothetical protein